MNKGVENVKFCLAPHDSSLTPGDSSRDREEMKLNRKILPRRIDGPGRFITDHYQKSAAAFLAVGMSHSTQIEK